ncbi:Uma2 family endonuclease [soil metagenome]
MVTTLLVTAEELLEMGSDARYELIEGVLKELAPSSSKSSAIGARVLIFVGQFVLEYSLGYTTNADGGYILSTSPHTVVAPDVGFFRADRYHGGMPDRGFYPLPPDLAVEVISPTDKRTDMAHKQDLYTRAGVPLVWWVDPEQRTVTVHRPGQKPEVLDESGTLDGGGVLPGFELDIETIFAV